MKQQSGTYHLVCGLEVHAELKTNSKMFCGCQNDPFHAPKPNMYTCPVCLGMPGGLPVANKKAIEWTLKLGLALNCEINLFSKFDRKHYFYPDLPKGYQISQYDIPFCEYGYIETSEGTVRIRRIHLEEDTGKLLHTTLNGEKVSLVDFNRSGVPLVEIVTEADIVSPTQAKEYGKKLRQILRYLDIADCDMEQGGMRLEANISLRPHNSKPTDLPNYKVEVKNINSFRFLEQAISYEIKRQSKELAQGNTPAQETRGWNVDKQETFSQRTKESAEDYRYFPDPDLPPLRFTKEEISSLKTELPPLPDEVVELWLAEFSVEKRYGSQLVVNRNTTELLTTVFEELKTQKQEPNQLASDLVNKKIQLSESAEEMIQVFKALHQTDDIDESELAVAIEAVKKDNPTELEAYKNGKSALINFFMGQVMKKLGKKVDPKQVIASLQKNL